MNSDEIRRLYDDAYAESYEDEFLRSPLTRADAAHELELLGGMLGPEVRWLDVACGTGYYLRHFPEIERTGLDLSPAMLRLAREGSPGIELREGDFTEPFPGWEDRFGLVSCMWYAYGLVDTIAQLRCLIANLAAWTAPGGTCFVPLADPRLITGVDLPYDATTADSGRVVITGIQWSYVEQDGRKVHAHQLAPNLEFMVEEFDAHFKDVSVVRYPPAVEGWPGRPALIAKEKRATPSTRAPAPSGSARRRVLGQEEPAGRPLFLMHIPKTAGTSAFRMIEQRFRVDGVATAWEGTFNGDPSGFDLVAGHLDLSFAERFERPPLIATFIRDPIARALSIWDYIGARDYTGEAARRIRATAVGAAFTTATELAHRVPLDEAIASHPDALRPFLGSMQTAYLMGRDFNARGEAPRGEADLERAIAGLERCDVIGLTEELDKGLEWLARTLGWSPFGPSLRENRGTGRTSRQALDTQTIERLTEWNELDLRLYAHARDLVAERRPDGPPPAPTGLPSACGYSFDQPLFGTGWHRRERDDRGWFCWTAGAPESVLEFDPPAAGSQRLRIDIAHSIGERALGELRASVNEVQVGLEHRERDGVSGVEGDVPADAVAARSHLTRLSLVPGDAVRPSDLDPGNSDDRLLGIGVRRIDLAPLGD